MGLEGALGSNTSVLQRADAVADGHHAGGVEQQQRQEHREQTRRHRLPSYALLALLAGCQTSTPTSVLLISMDTFRADRIGRLGADGQSLTPSLDALASRSVVFTSTYAPANETLFSHAALFTSRPASTWGALDASTWQLPVQSKTLAGQLAQSGFWTEAIVAGGHLSPIFGLNTGFRRYASMDDWASFQQTAPLAIERLEALSSQPQPFFLVVHGYDTHTPYVKAGPLYRSSTPGYDGPLLASAREPDLYEQLHDGIWYPDYHPGQGLLSGTGQGTGHALVDYQTDPDVPKVALTPADLDFLTGSYDLAAAHADAWVGALLAAVEDAGLADSTIVVVLGDHGEDLMEEGWFNHRHTLSDITLHVPLIVHIPGHDPAIIDTPTSLIDVAPTLLSILGQAPPAEWSGRALLDASLPARAVYSESPQDTVSLRTPTERLVTTRDALSAGFPTAPGPEDRFTGPSWAAAEPLWRQLQERLP